MNLSDVIKLDEIKYINANNFTDAYIEMYNKNYPGVRYIETITIPTNEDVDMNYQDIIYDISSSDGTIFYIIDNIKYNIKKTTRFAKLISPFANLFIRVIGTEKKDIELSFTRILLDTPLRNKVLTLGDTIYDTDVVYIYGAVKSH